MRDDRPDVLAGAAQEAGERSWEAGTWDSLGYIHFGLSDVERSVTGYQTAIDLYRQLGDRYYEAETLAALGDLQHASGDTNGAEQTWRLAHDILADLHHPEAVNVRARLARFQRPVSPLHHSRGASNP